MASRGKVVIPIVGLGVGPRKQINLNPRSVPYACFKPLVQAQIFSYRCWLKEVVWVGYSVEARGDAGGRCKPSLEKRVQCCKKGRSGVVFDFGWVESVESGGDATKTPTRLQLARYITYITYHFLFHREIKPSMHVSPCSLL